MIPKISVIIPTYNCACYIPEAINSILNQTYQDFEIIIVDDASKDNTKEIINDYLGKYPNKIRYFSHFENKGIPESRNKGIREARGEYIAFVDADDELDKKALERYIHYIESYNSDWCITDILRIEDNKKEILNSNINLNEKDFLFDVLENGYTTIRRGYFFSKKAILDINMFDNFLKIYEDWDLYIRMLESNKKFIYIKEPLYIYKIRKDSIVRNNIKESLFYILKLLKKHHKRLADSGNKEIRKIYSEQMWSLARDYFYKIKDIKKTLYCITESLKYKFQL